MTADEIIAIVIHFIAILCNFEYVIGAVCKTISIAYGCCTCKWLIPGEGDVMAKVIEKDDMGFQVENKWR